MARFLFLGVAVAVFGCASPAPVRSWLAPLYRSASTSTAATPPANLEITAHAPAPTAFVERALHARGLRFGTDGSVGALYWYLRNRHRAIATADARAGDVVFFDLAADGGCGSHLGLVASVDSDGRIAFRELRGSSALRLSYVYPGDPRRRRDQRGRILNTFLRGKNPDDAPGTTYYAGEMLCAIFRAR